MPRYLILYRVISVMHYAKTFKAADDAEAGRKFRKWRDEYADQAKARKAKLIPLVDLADERRR